MCGRFTLYSPIQELFERFHIEPFEISYNPRFNIALSQHVISVINDGIKIEWDI